MSSTVRPVRKLLMSLRGRQWGEDEAHMKINLPLFKDKDAKDAETYQSWRWDLTGYHCAGCQDHMLLPYTIQSLQGYPGELVQSSRMDKTWDNVLTILDKHYNNVKMPWTKSYSNYGWQIRKPSQIGAFAYWDTFKSWLLLSLTISLLTMWLS